MEISPVRRSGDASATSGAADHNIEIVESVPPVIADPVGDSALGGIRIPHALLVVDIAALALAAWATGMASSGLWLSTAIIFVIMAGSGGLYRSRLTLLLLDDVPALIGRLLAAAALGAVIHGGAGIRSDDGWWQFVLLASLAIVAGRAVMYSAIRWARRSGRVNHRTIIVGSGQVGTGLAQSLIEFPEYGLRPVAFYDPEPLVSGELPVMGPNHNPLDNVIEAARARVVILAFSPIPETDVVRFVRECARSKAEMFYVPRLFELHSLSSREIDEVRAIPMVRLRRAPLRSLMWRVKRLLDIAVASLALLVLSPLLAAIALGVRADMGRPVLFRQRRVSIDGDEFMIIKFRTLPTAEESRSDTDWTGADRQPTAFGRCLRATSLDELPQLWNVLRGDMSLVGPRPERAHFASEFATIYNNYGDRHRVPAGLTGLAQIHGHRGDTSIEERARFDNAYVERWSLANDIKILLRTTLAALRWRGQ